MLQKLDCLDLENATRKHMIKSARFEVIHWCTNFALSAKTV